MSPIIATLALLMACDGGTAEPPPAPPPAEPQAEAPAAPPAAERPTPEPTPLPADAHAALTDPSQAAATAPDERPTFGSPPRPGA